MSRFMLSSDCCCIPKKKCEDLVSDVIISAAVTSTILFFTVPKIYKSILRRVECEIEDMGGPTGATGLTGSTGGTGGTGTACGLRQVQLVHQELQVFLVQQEAVQLFHMQDRLI